MPNNIKVSDMEQAVELTKDDLVMIAQPNIDPENPEAEVESYSSKKTTIEDLANTTAKDIQFTSDLDTDSKTIVGAINEAAAVGKKSDGYTSSGFSANYDWSTGYQWEDSGETIDGHTVYRSSGGTYQTPDGDSLCTFTVEGYNSVTFYIKQDGATSSVTNKAYLVMGDGVNPVSLQYYNRKFNGDVFQDFESYTEYCYGMHREYQFLYHVDPTPGPGTVAFNGNNGQWIDSGETIDGHTVYKSDAGSYGVYRGTSKCTLTLNGVKSISLYCKSGNYYGPLYAGELDTTIDTSDSDTYKRVVSENPNYVKIDYVCADAGEHTLEILFMDRDGDGLRGYFYYTINEVNTNRGYVYMVLGEPTEPKGEVFNNYTDNIALGTNSHAEGSRTKAYGQAGHAEGYNTQAIGEYSHAEGYENKAYGEASHVEGGRNQAYGEKNHAEGADNIVRGSYAHVEGRNNQAINTASHAEGGYTLARDNYAHAEGQETQALGGYSHAEGCRTIALYTAAHAEGYETQANGSYTHAEGYQTYANSAECHTEGYHTTANAGGGHAEGCETLSDAYAAHSEGNYTIASGESSHAEGQHTEAIGVGAHVEGSNLSYNTEGPKALGLGAHAEGILTKAEGVGSHAEGIPAIKYQEYDSTETYNIDDIVYYFEGNDNTSRIAFARAYVNNIQGISPKDNQGWRYWTSYSPSDDPSSYFYSINGYYSSAAIGMGAHAEGVLAIASGDGSHAEGRSTVASSEGAHAEGGFTSATAYFGHAEGNYTEASGNFAHAEGLGNSSTHNIASGVASHVEGSQNKASGDFSHAEGQFAYAVGQESHAENSGTYAYGMSSHAEGAGTVVYSEQSHVEGSGSYAYGGITHVEGAGNISTGSNAHVEGSGNRNLSFSSHTEGSGNYNYGPQSHVEGAGNTLSGEEGHVEGAGNNAHGPKNHVECGGNTVFGLGSHAEGKHNIVVGFGHHAEGWLNSIGTSSSVNYFSPNTTYEENDIVAVDALFNNYNEENSNFLYRCKDAPGQIQSGEGVEIITPTQWNNSTAYSAGSVVYVQLNWYPCYLIFYCSSAVEAGMNPLTNGKNYWSSISSYLSPIQGTSSAGYYLLTIPTSSSLKVAKVAANVTIEPMWEPVATNLSAHVEGYKNIALGNYQHVQGKYNTPDAQKAFIIGNGSETEGVITRSNAMTVDWNGNMALAGDITPGTSLNTTATTLGGAINEIVARIPAPPTVDGTYTLSVTVSNGVPTYSWV